MPASDPKTDRFIAALGQLEQKGNLTLILDLFTHDAKVGSIALRHPLEGLIGAKKFWTDYLSAFQQVTSRFNHVHVSNDLAVLEWISEGKLPDGSLISYQGASILEFTGDKISRFRTYYDSAAFMPEGAKLLGREISQV